MQCKRVMFFVRSEAASFEKLYDQILSALQQHAKAASAVRRAIMEARPRGPELKPPSLLPCQLSFQEGWKRAGLSCAAAVV